MDFDAFIKILFQKAQQAGLQEYEVYYSGGERFGVTVFRGEIDRYQVAATAGISLRALYNGKMGYAFSEVLDEEAADMLVASCIQNAQIVTKTDVDEIFAGSEAYVQAESYSQALGEVTPAQKIELAFALENSGKQKNALVRDVQYCTVQSGEGMHRIVNSKGLNLSARSNYVVAMLAPIIETNGRMYDGSAYKATLDFDTLDADALAQEAVEDALHNIGAKPVPSGQYRIVFKQEAFCSLLAAFTGVLDADNAQKGLSLLAGKEGETIASTLVTLVDDPFMPEGLNITTFDGEGVATRKNVFIQNGVLQTLMHNLKTAKKAGVQTTGNGSRGVFSSQIGITPFNLYIAPGTSTKQEILQVAEGGLYITELNGLHAGTNAVSGDFSLNAKGFVIQNGQMAQAVEEITIAGNFFELLKKIDYIADNLKMDMPSSACFGCPTLSVSSLAVAGI